MDEPDDAGGYQIDDQRHDIYSRLSSVARPAGVCIHPDKIAGCEQRRDLIGVWILWLGTQTGVSRMVPSHTKSVSALLIQNPLKVVLWMATSLSAGFSEEVAFRGYFQKQFEAMTGSSVAG